MIPSNIVDNIQTAGDTCPICGSISTRAVREVRGQRTGVMRPVHFCYSCFSISVKTDYKETHDVLRADLEWNKSKIERNTLYARGLIGNLLSRRRGIRSVLEIGCGIGTLLNVASKEFGLKVEGFDINEEAIVWGNRNFNLEMKAEPWNSSSFSRADLLLNISCLEHIAQPRGLIAEMAAFARKRGAGVFISVPFFNPRSWHYLNEESDGSEGTPFHDNDVHVTLFSFLGITSVMREFGMPCFQYLKRDGWSGFLFTKNFPILKSGPLSKESDRLREKWRNASVTLLNSVECPECMKPSAPDIFLHRE